MRTQRPKSVQKETAENIQHIFKEKGEKALQIARELVAKEAQRITSKAGQALQYFMNEYGNGVVGPALISLGCEAVEGNPVRTIHAAVPIVLISGSADIHDDIIDMTKIKNGRPTVYGKYGQDIAVLVGDALLFKGLIAFQTAAEHFSNDEFSKTARILNDSFFLLGDAEALEIRFRANLNVTPEEYLEVMWKKAADVEGLFRIGALLGGGVPHEIDVLGSYGRVFGLQSILRDDWIDMIEFQELKHRIQFESLPLPLLYLLEDDVIKSKIGPLLRGKITKKDAEHIYRTTQESGGFERTKKVMVHLAKKAENSLSRASILTPDLKAAMQFVWNVNG